MDEDGGGGSDSRESTSSLGERAAFNYQPVHVGASPARTSDFSLFFVLRLVLPEAGGGKQGHLVV